MKPYIQKDLGYPRTPTTAKLRVTMPDGSIWAVPVQIVADSRDAWFNAEQKSDGCKEDTVKECRDCNQDEDDLADWAENNMDWIDVVPYAERVIGTGPPDYQEGWVNGDKQIVGEI